MTQATTVFFCTYKSAETKSEWRKSKEYNSIDTLLGAMLPYLRKYPNAQVTYQTRNIYTQVQTQP